MLRPFLGSGVLAGHFKSTLLASLTVPNDRCFILSFLYARVPRKLGIHFSVGVVFSQGASAEQSVYGATYGPDLTWTGKRTLIVLMILACGPSIVWLTEIPIGCYGREL